MNYLGMKLPNKKTLRTSKGRYFYKISGTFKSKVRKGNVMTLWAKYNDCNLFAGMPKIDYIFLLCKVTDTPEYDDRLSFSVHRKIYLNHI